MPRSDFKRGFPLVLRIFINSDAGFLMLRLILLTTLAAATCADPLAAAPDEARLLRFPAIHGDQIVFTYAGDLYTVSASGGIARRLTSHDGFEMFPRFSPDGK